MRGNIAALARKGENEIVLELDYFQSQQTYDVFDGFYYGNGEVTETLMNCVSYETNIEAMYLFGSFSVRPDSGWQAGENGVRFGDRFRLLVLRPQTLTWRILRCRASRSSTGPRA